MGNSRLAIVDVARTVGFEGVDEASMEELVQSYMEELSIKNLL
jgi:hypothetical protein